MTYRTKLLLLTALCFSTLQSKAVQVNPDGLGEVLIYPYYSVNNDLNTLYTVVNTTAQPKAISVRFLEGDIGHVVLLFNIYLAPFDVWTGAMVPTTSSIGGHLGEPSVLHLTAETSCAPFLNKSGQEFLPYVIDLDSDPENLSMQRATEGYIEIFEMGELTGLPATWVTHDTSGVPANCAEIEAEWDDNVAWDAAPLNDPTGGLLGSGFIVNVAEGIAFSYDAIALQNFWQGAGLHTEPGSLELDLNAAFPESTVLLDNGEVADAEWSEGFQAVSAVLTKHKIINDYALDAVVAGRTEWVVSMPTKGFHTNTEDVSLLSPFSEVWDGSFACERFRMEIWDREGAYQGTRTKRSPTPPGGFAPKMCEANNVIEISLPGTPVSADSRILGSDDFILFFTPANANTENGWGQIEFLDAQAPTPTAGTSLKGLPVTGFAVQQFTNAGAAEGLLAQYGALFKHKYQVEMTDSTNL